MGDELGMVNGGEFAGQLADLVEHLPERVRYDEAVDGGCLFGTVFLAEPCRVRRDYLPAKEAHQDEKAQRRDDHDIVLDRQLLAPRWESPSHQDSVIGLLAKLVGPQLRHVFVHKVAGIF